MAAIDSLAKLRKDLGALTPTQRAALATRAGVAERSVRRIMGGARPNFDTYERLASALRGKRSEPKFAEAA